MRAFLDSVVLAAATLTGLALLSPPARASWASQYLHQRFDPVYPPHEPSYGYYQPGYRDYRPGPRYYPPPPPDVQQDDAQFIVSLYHNYLGREPGSWEVDGWLQRLDQLRGNRSKLVEEFQKAARVELGQRPPWRR
jgi:hypothetical protein